MFMMSLQTNTPSLILTVQVKEIEIKASSKRRGQKRLFNFLCKFTVKKYGIAIFLDNLKLNCYDNPVFFERRKDKTDSIYST